MSVPISGSVVMVTGALCLFPSGPVYRARYRPLGGRVEISPNVAFVIDAYARRILGWRVATTMTTSMVMDALEQAIWTRQREGHDDFTALIAHTDHGVQYQSIRYSERIAVAGITPSVGAVGSSYDNALAETINGLYKTEVIRRLGPWHSVDQVEHATAEWVDWFNTSRLFEYCGDVPPVELEQAHYHQNQPPTEAA